MEHMKCGTFRVPSIRPELQVAFDEMNATGEFFAFAVCQTWDGKHWEVNTKMGRIFIPLNDTFASKEEAQSAGYKWLCSRLDNF